MGPVVAFRKAAIPQRRHNHSPPLQRPAGTASERPTVPSSVADTHHCHRHQQQQPPPQQQQPPVRRHRQPLTADRNQHYLEKQQERQQQRLARPGAVRRDRVDGKRLCSGSPDGWPDDDGGGAAAAGGSHGCDSTSPAAGQTSFLVQSIRTWEGALQLLDIAGGPEGRPPPQLQLELLLRSRRFNTRDRGDSTVAPMTTSSHHNGLSSSVPTFADAGADASTTMSGAADSQNRTLFATWVEEPNSRNSHDAGRVCSGTIPPMPVSTPRCSRRAAAGIRPRSLRPTTAAEDASWRADWELAWEVEVQSQSIWLREPAPQPPTPPPSPLAPLQHGVGAAAEEPLPAPMRTSPAVMLPGHHAAATMAVNTWGLAAAELNQHSPIPPMRTLNRQAPQASFPPPNQTPHGDVRKQRKGPPPRPPPVLQQREQAPTAVSAAPAAVGSRLDDNGSHAALLGRASWAVDRTGHRVEDTQAALAAEVLLRIVCDAVVVQPEAWTSEEVAALLRHAAKLAYRYPGLLSAQPGRQRHVQYQSSTAAAPLPSSPSIKRNSAVSVPAAQSVGGHQHRAALDALTGGMDAGEPSSGGGGGGAELRVRLQQLLLRVDGMLTPPRQEHPAAAAPPVERRWTRRPAALSAAGTAAPAGGSGGGSTNVVTAVAAAGAMAVATSPSSPLPPATVGHVGAGAETAVVAAGAVGAASQSLSASAAVWAVWAAAALQLRISPEGSIRRRLLEEFRPWRRRPPPFLPKPWRRSAPHHPLNHREAKGERQQPPSAQRWAGDCAGGPQHALQQQQQQQRPWQLRRLKLLDMQKPTVGRRGPRLDAGDVADVLWAFAMLGLRMPRYHLDKALRAVSDSNSRRLVLRPTRSSAAGLDLGAKRDWARAPTAHSLSSKPASSSAAAAAVGPYGDGGVGRGGSGAGASSGSGVPACGYLARGLAQLRPSQLTALAWAAVELLEVVGQEGVTAVWAAQLFAATQTRLSRLSPSQLVDLLWSIGRGRRRPTGPWRRAMAAALLTAAPRLVPWQAARAAAAYAKLRIPVPYTVAAALLNTLHRNLATAQPSDVAAMVWALPYIMHPYTELFVRRHRKLLLDCAISTQPTLPSLEPAQLVQLVDGFAKLRQLPGEEWMRLHREACIRLKSRFSEPNRRKIRQAYATMLSL
ncbi:hypothetical protein VOLCADRAFT_94654 [Volvox carteri f. nagariensis]|uniref:Uncharacterized protein n=1 Tax=Volvox carteri f. nagariensis TaxID=3068 RepID=D8U5D3_VOLCA|nr:uncharacterized protein VOLCADRAFT_94654 [Volvox carteri f. nagariensis]EFJ45129.1 hypothetical protein VOLCADRAFT_94654 [Volvox carteri f. nagariensis]|eukprot:XP_002953805.1 hypothetical protein VOLCADRAFT_94654 [Volvox carteri f. nagariensis]